MIYITKIFSFEAAHALKDYNGACANIHGHSYRLEVSIAPAETFAEITDNKMPLKTQRLRRASAEMRERTEVRDRVSNEAQSCDLVRAEQVSLLCRARATSLRSNNFRKDLRNLEISDDGMVWDFNNLKKTVQETLLNRFDHSLLLNSSSDQSLLDILKGQFEKVLILPFQPTSENLVQYFASLLKAALPKHLRLKRMVLYETATSFVTYEED